MRAKKREFRKCRYQLDNCRNWTDEGLTLGIGMSYVGPKDAQGFSTLVAVDQPICSACLAMNPEPMGASS